MDLLAALEASWPPAESVRLGPWRLRRGAGGGRRVSAATLEEGVGEAALAAALDAGLAALAAWGESAVFRILPGQEALDALLAARGFALDAPTIIYAGDAGALADRRSDLAVIDCDAPIAVQREIWAAAGVGPARLAVMARVAVPRRYLLGRLDDRTAGAAFVAAAEAGMLNALHVAPWARHRGLARRMTGWAAAWAAEAGAETLALAVEVENAPARALYEGMGMRAAGGYYYRVARDRPGRTG